MIQQDGIDPTVYWFVDIYSQELASIITELGFPEKEKFSFNCWQGHINFFDILFERHIMFPWKQLTG